MKRILVIRDFKHAGRQYYKGDSVTVTPEDAGYFCGVGWARAEGLETGDPDLSDKKLEVQNGKHGLRSSNAG